MPTEGLRRKVSTILVMIAESWIACNALNIAMTQKIEWDVRGEGFDLNDLAMDKSYLLISNHQSWFDIVTLQFIFNRRIPFIRFFLKQELIYVPILGFAWLALDFPFMKRFSPEYLAKHPERRGDDMKATQKACEKFQFIKVSVLNFVEGTRLTPAKHQKDGKHFKYLLSPKRGGISYVLQAMGNKFDSLLDVTIVYPDGAKSLLQACAGQVNKMVIRVRRIPIPAQFCSSSWDEDMEARRLFKEWIQQIWQEKDKLIESLLVQK